MAQIGQVIARRMTAGKSNHVRHIAKLKWQDSDGLIWSTRDQMVARVSNRPGMYFTSVRGYRANLYVVHHNGDSWVQTEPDETKIDNLLYLPEE